MTPRRAAAVGLSVAVALALAACGPGGNGAVDPATTPSHSTGPDPAAAVELQEAEVPDCAPPASRGFRAGPQDEAITVVTLADAERGVVLAPQNNSSLCQWVEQMQRLADEGYAVASFDWPQDDAQGVHAAVAALREVGATSIALMGASKGGTYVAALAGDMVPAPVGVVALGPPDQFNLDARSESSSYTGPLLVVATTDDPYVDAEKSALVARADEPETFVELDGRAHGVELFDSEHAEQVEDLIDTFLADAFGG